MHSPYPSPRIRHRIIGSVVLLILIVAAGWWWAASHRPPAAPMDRSQPPVAVRSPVKGKPLIDFKALPEDPALQNLMKQRHDQYGLEHGLDLIVEKDETFRIGDTTVSMAEIARMMALREGRIVETGLSGEGSADAKTPHFYGIHVVRPGESIWNIHFQLLQAYFARKGITLSPLADEPKADGSSSGVARMLKFSERMVYIYNLTEHRMDTDLRLIQPLSKIVIYNMDQVFALLDRVDYHRVDHIRFDGETLWIPAPR